MLAKMYLVFAIAFIYVTSFGLPLLPLLFITSMPIKIIWVLALPITFPFTLLFSAALVAAPTHKAMVSGIFPRDLNTLLYAARRVYGLAWTSIFYFKPFYWLLLSFDTTKWMLFRMFGYKGQTDFTVYPDTWLRDIPRLTFGKKSYIANRSTIGTNICLSDGNIMVGKIKTGERAVIGHMVIVGPGTRVGNQSEVGVGVAGGIRVRMGNHVDVEPKTGLNHGVLIEDNVKIGAASYIGVKAVIKEGLKLLPATNIPNGAVVATQDDVDRYISSESHKVLEERIKISDLISNHLKHSGIERREANVKLQGKNY